MGVATSDVDVGAYIQGLRGYAPMSYVATLTSRKSVDLSLVVLTRRLRIQALSMYNADTVFHMRSQSMQHIYSALQGIESAALPGEYLDIDNPRSLIDT